MGQAAPLADSEPSFDAERLDRAVETVRRSRDWANTEDDFREFERRVTEAYRAMLD